jgi:hypothetical protein
MCIPVTKIGPASREKTKIYENMSSFSQSSLFSTGDGIDPPRRDQTVKADEVDVKAQRRISALFMSYAL